METTVSESISTACLEGACFIQDCAFTCGVVLLTKKKKKKKDLETKSMKTQVSAAGTEKKRKKSPHLG